MASKTTTFRSPIAPDELTDSIGWLECLGLAVAFVAFAVVAVNLLILQVPGV